MKRGDRVIMCAACGQRLGVHRVVREYSIGTEVKFVPAGARQDYAFLIYPPGHAETRCLACAGPDGMSSELADWYRAFHTRNNSRLVRHQEDPEEELKASRRRYRQTLKAVAK